ncbi:MAG: sulfotransferase domain-containing protein [Thermomicrobiales bacterium]|nr:sulfotransferase domain-containing protein [Thermomicrobiales bacterium]
MRIVVAAPPKTGNMWLKCLLGSIYDLRWLKPKETPARAELGAFRKWVSAGGFVDGSIYHQHYDYSDELCDIADSVGAHLVTLVRNPYDAFVSTYFTLQQHYEEQNRKERKMTELMGKPLDHPDVVDFLRRGGYHNNLVKARDWMSSGRAVVLRYEALHTEPSVELGRATAQIAPVESARIAAAIETCNAENMRQRSRGMAKHVRAARPDDARRRLSEAHYEAFREAYGELIEELGYAVR